MESELTPQELRVIGCLLEKESTTPEQYPLSLNGLTVACNQKSNREPVMALSETEVQSTLDSLTHKRLVREESGFGSRVPKYRHRFCNTEFGELQLNDQQRAIICVLFLRGPQTPGELRTRTQRLCEFTDVNEVEKVLQTLTERESGALLKRLPREPGKREQRYCHLFGDATDAVDHPTAAEEASAPSGDLLARIEQLEATVATLQAELKELKGGNDARD